MSPDDNRVICIGGATVDRKYRTRETVRLGTSNPVTSERSFGGVARNVAETITRLGTPSTLVTILGEDENGRAIRDNLVRLGIDTRHVAISRDHATAEYVAILDPDGELVLGLADMAILDGLTPSLLHETLHETVHGTWPALSTALLNSWIFADCNLPSPTLHALLDLARRHSRMLAFDAVSALKVMRLPRDLAGVGILFLNLDEARAFLGEPDATPREIAVALRACGAARVVLTLGEGGVLTIDSTGLASVAPVPARIVDATGAGDALIAATLVALRAGRSLADSVRTGTVAAALTLESPHSVRPDLSPALLESALARSVHRKPEGEIP